MAGSYEQVTRATGPVGYSPLANTIFPGTVTDSGRYALYMTGAPDQFDATGARQRPQAMVRDIVDNTTTPLGGGNIYSVLGLDQAETKVLALRYVAPGSSEVVVVPLVGTAPAIVLATFTSFTGDVWGAISGDGNSVVYSYISPRGARGPFKVDIATGTATPILPPRVDENGDPLQDLEFYLGGRSISDNGAVIAGNYGGGAGGAYVAGGVPHDVPGAPIVSPDGTTVAWLTSPGGDSFDNTQVAVRKLATGVTQTFALPAALVGGSLGWIAGNGGKLVVTKSPSPAQYLTMATGQWAPFGGPYSREIGSDITSRPAAISRNARHALVSYGPSLPQVSKQLALVDLTGGDLPGAQETLAPSSFVAVKGLWGCQFDGQATISVRFSRPTAWATPMPYALVIVKADGVEVFRKWYTRADYPASGSSFSTVVNATLPASASMATKLKVEAYVTDGSRSTADHQLLKPQACAPEQSPF